MSHYSLDHQEKTLGRLCAAKSWVLLARALVSGFPPVSAPARRVASATPALYFYSRRRCRQNMRPWHADDLPTERGRYCGATQPGKGAQCATSDSKGSWRIWDTSACIARCALCAQCHHVSHGTDGDCSWFRKCPRLYESASIHGKPPELTHDTYRVRDSRGLLLPSIATADQWVHGSAKTTRPEG